MAEASSSRTAGPSTRSVRNQDTEVAGLDRLLSLEAAAFQRDLEVRLICLLHPLGPLTPRFLGNRIGRANIEGL